MIDDLENFFSSDDDDDETEEGFPFVLEIEDVRILYNLVEKGLRDWPGSPARPAEEQTRLYNLKLQFKAMLFEDLYQSD